MLFYLRLKTSVAVSRHLMHLSLYLSPAESGDLRRRRRCYHILFMLWGTTGRRPSSSPKPPARASRVSVVAEDTFTRLRSKPPATRKEGLPRFPLEGICCCEVGMVFSRGHATLHLAVSVGTSVRRSVTFLNSEQFSH